MTPPLSRTAFPLAPKSVLLISVDALKPARVPPYGSAPNPPNSRVKVTGLVTPRMVMSPSSRKVPRASAKFGFDFLTCGDAARHAGDGGLLGGHGPGDDHEGSSGHMPITKDHARCHHRPRTPSLTNSTRTSSPTYRKRRRRCWPR